MEETTKKLWEKCVAFHGHSCPGLATGFQAARYAIELLELTDRSGDEEVVCVTENDACGVDAIQVILGCTAGKGNLIFDLQGKMAFSFYRRDTGKSIRLVLRPTPALDRQAKLKLLTEGDCHDFFDVKAAPEPLPEPARILRSCTCSLCGEQMAETHAHLQDGKIVCDRCWKPYRRGSR